MRVGKNARADGGIQAELGKIAPLCPSHVRPFKKTNDRFAGVLAGQSVRGQQHGLRVRRAARGGVGCRLGFRSSWQVEPRFVDHVVGEHFSLGQHAAIDAQRLDFDADCGLCRICAENRGEINISRAYGCLR